FDGVDPDAYFGDDMVLYIQVRGARQMIRIHPRAEEMVIGRQADDSAMVPDIDLAAFDAENMGVSRLHAGLKRQDNTLVLTDMGSLNKTHINGQRLHAHEVRVLHDGDELRLGRLQMRVYFRLE
ncbi:MAG: FHA domain-containing protein, partial [Chloroflexi bacterium]|nr:FHA domain-containing protein [Chloroflexota bacterium]